MMIAIISCIRVSGIRITGSIDSTWNMFWQHMEACVAVTMISLTAFRSVFIASELKGKIRKRNPWHSLRLEKLRAKQDNNGLDAELGVLPAIPSATLSGIRTFIRGSRKPHNLASEAGSLHSQHPLSQNQEEGIRVVYGLSSDVLMVRA